MQFRAEHYKNYIEEQSDYTLTMHVLRLKKEIARLKRKIEAVHYGSPRPMEERDALKINWYRWYVQDTLAALDKIEKTYPLDEREKRALQFQKNISSISRLTFYIGGYLGGIEKYEISIESDEAHIVYSLSDTVSVPPMILMEPDHLPKKEFFALVHSLYMGEWKKDYSTQSEDFMLFDNIHWNVEIVYKKGFETREYGGLNAFPYNFSRFLQFFEAHKKTVDQI